MKSSTTRQFRQRFAELPAEVQQQARTAYRTFVRDHHHPGLRFKKVHAKKPIYSARVGIHHRAIGIVKADRVVWFWIGHHSEYEQLLKQF